MTTSPDGMCNVMKTGRL